MKPQPLPHQLAGAEFLAALRSALLADMPRVGKTGAAILACDLVRAQRVLVVTTATNRFNFARDFERWQSQSRTVGVLNRRGATDSGTGVVILPWSLVGALMPQWLRQVTWDVLILDEAHYAKNPTAARTAAVFNAESYDLHGLAFNAERTWLLTGTPIPNAPIDLWPALRALEPERLAARDGLPDVTTFDAFQSRYCTGYPMKQRWRSVFVVTGGKNEAELGKRLDGWWLRRTQADVGITPPQYDLLLLDPAVSLSRIAGETGDLAEVLAAAEAGDTRKLDLHLGTLRRLTGTIKADLVADVVDEEFRNGLDSVVLMCWHRDTIDRTASRLAAHGVVTLSGDNSPKERQAAQDDFQSGRVKVFVGQVQAAGEAIDLSRSANLIFVEPSFVPKDMAQAALRITNHGQKRTPLVRAAVLAGSIDEQVTAVLLKKVASIKAVWSDT